MNERSEKLHLMNDPIHGVMELEARDHETIKPIIDNPLFQRLRHIKQLSMADLVFPGATHTRFSHSIGAAYIAKQVIEKLDERTGSTMQSEERKLLVQAALLHDIGHGPFSHAFEELFDEKLFPDRKQKDPIKHDKHWTTAFLQEMGLKDPKLGALIRQSKEDREILKDFRFADMISSQLDVDRLDYLLRDSYFCGVKYGQYDLPWLLNCLTRRKNGADKIGITAKGVASVEHYILARRLMTKNIYYHPKIKGAELLLVWFLEKLRLVLNEQKNLFPSVSPHLQKFLIGISEYLNGDEKDIAFVKNQFDNYRHLTDFHIWEAIRQFSRKELAPEKESDLFNECIALAERLDKRELPSSLLLDPQFVTSAEEQFKALKLKIQPTYDWQIYFRALDLKTYKTTADEIFVVKENKNADAVDLQSFSQIISDQKDKIEKVYICFIDQRLKEKHSETIKDAIDDWRTANYIIR